MTIHLVRETIDARQASLRAQSGELLPLVRGVYVDTIGDVDATILSHAVRIARYLFPTAYLASASSVLLGPTPDARLFIAGRRNQRTRLRSLEIVQNEAPDHPSIVPAIVGDDRGELRIDASSPRQRFLEAFRLRSEHASAVTPAMRTAMAAHLVEDYGSARQAADALWLLAREHAWYREGEGAERFLMGWPRTNIVPANAAIVDLRVAWHGELQGRLVHDGYAWRWRPAKPTGPSLVRQTVPGKLPPLIESLLPEGWLAEVLHLRDERETLRAGRRYLSNIVVVEKAGERHAMPPDVLRTELARFADKGRFTGRYAGPEPGTLEGSFEQNLARLFARSETPRLSGVQIKAPMGLTSDGTLVPAIDGPFTHILKPAGTAGFDMLPMVEWLCLELGRAAGFEVPTAALIDMPDGMPPALLVERFDIRHGPDDTRRLALEDFCSVLDLPASAKYDGTIERMARSLRPLSTDPLADTEILFRRALFAWLVADGDMHLKNLALLKIAAPGARHFATVRLAPLYDAVTTRVFPGLANDRMALKLNGKDDRLTRQDFLALARIIDLPSAVAIEAIGDMVSRLRAAVPGLAIPEFARHAEAARGMEQRVGAIVLERTAGIA